jgi:hypothetical protein
MKEANDINLLAEEKNEVAALFNREAIKQFEEQIGTVPADYFNSFSEKIVTKIQVKKKPSLILQLNKLSIAAAIMILLVGSYFFVNKYNNSANNAVAIHEIPTAELDAYVSNNDWIVDAEMQTEINKLGLNLDSDNKSKDSID